MKLTIEEIAKVAHEVNRAFCNSIGDDTQFAWEGAPEWQRKSAVEGVEFLKKNPKAKPSDTHDSWLISKEKDGWKYGLIKDAVKKEHPCFVPYDALPIEQRSKDYVFQGVVRALLKL